MRRPGFLITALLAAALTALVAPASAASAAEPPAPTPTAQQRLTTLAALTQPTSSSWAAWNDARAHRADVTVAAYGFDWRTDYCTYSPDEPLGYDFRLPCWRHDFGYENYAELGLFRANKARLDSAFYVDLLRTCGGYRLLLQPTCRSLAWTYYQAVRLFGTPTVSTATVERARRHG